MKIEVYANTKWIDTRQVVVIDTHELGYTDEEWDNLSEDQRQDEVLQIAYDAIGFSFAYNYAD